MRLDHRPVGTTGVRSLDARVRPSGAGQRSSDMLSAPTRHALHEAAVCASAILVDSEGKTAEEIQAQLEGVVDLVAEVVGDRAPDAATDPRCNVPRRHVELLRERLVEVLDGLADLPDGREVVAVLRALHEVAHRVESSPTGRFVARLAGDESVKAVVEIAHDIRSPLSSILFLVDTIRRGQSGKVSPIQERQLGLVYGAALGLSTLASDLIDAVRGERLVDGRPIPFSITETIMSVCAIVEPIGEEKGLPLNVSYPRIDGRFGYPSAINRVLLNLTSNALRYTESGCVSIGCSELGGAGTMVEFWVEDTGRGIPESVLGMLYDGFRPGPVGMRFSSAGLGLAISRTLVEAMGSTLDVRTSPETGTRLSFRLDLPVV